MTSDRKRHLGEIFDICKVHLCVLSENASLVSPGEGRPAVPAGVPPAGALADALQALLPRLQGARRRAQEGGRLHGVHAQPLHLEHAVVTVSGPASTYYLYIDYYLNVVV